jgi:hypothetical protein
MRTLATIVLVAVATSCAGNSPRAGDPSTSDSTTASTAIKPGSNGTPFDSATAHRLCANPDSVLAGTQPCTLKDQARPNIRPGRPPR